MPAGCGNELQQAQAVTESGNQDDDGGPGTGTSGTAPGNTQASGMGSGGGTSDGTGDGPTDGSATTNGSATTDGGTTGNATGADTSGSTSAAGSSTGSSGCRSDEDCARPTSVCDVPSGECVGCLPGRDTCEAGEYCDPALLDCVVGCDDQTDCTDQVCDVAAHVCVDCVIGTDCPTGVCTNNLCVTLGYDCLGNSNNCNPGEQCCAAMQCAGECMIPCGSIADCPPTMGCEHGWCLFPCNDNNADCAAWPGYSCQHSGTLCEAD